MAHDQDRVFQQNMAIVLKNSIIRHPHFSANFHCISKVDANCPEQTKTAARIARPVFWPTLWLKISTASQRVTFSPVFGKTGVFQHNLAELTYPRFTITSSDTDRFVCLYLRILRNLIGDFTRRRAGLKGTEYDLN